MGFWDSLATGLNAMNAVAKGMSAHDQVRTWMNTPFQDMQHMDSEVQIFVNGKTLEDLSAMHEAFKVLIKGQILNEVNYNKILWLFASFHGAWSVRLSQQHRH